MNTGLAIPGHFVSIEVNNGVLDLNLGETLLAWLACRRVSK